MRYRIETQDSSGNWELTPEGEYTVKREALKGARSLHKNCGWTGIRVVDTCDSDELLLIPRVAGDDE